MVREGKYSRTAAVWAFLLTSTFLSGQARAQAPACPTDTTITEFQGSVGVNSFNDHPIDMFPCETVLVQLSGSFPAGGSPAVVAMKMSIRNADGAELAFNNFECTSTSCSVEIPEPGTKFGYPLPGTRGAGGLARSVRVSASTFNYWAEPPVSYTLTITRQPRPLYNMGGTNFSNAPVIAPAVTQYGSVHPLETEGDPIYGQYYRLRLQPQQQIYVKGQARGTGRSGIFYIDLYDANQVKLKNLVSILVGLTTKSFPADGSNPVTHTNNTGAEATYYLRVKASTNPTQDFHFEVVSPGYCEPSTLTLNAQSMAALASSCALPTLGLVDESTGNCKVPPASVSRGSRVTVCVIGATGATFSDWKYASESNGTVRRTLNVGARTWSGTVVESGVVSVIVRSGGAEIPVPPLSVTVDARPGWALGAKAASKRPWGFESPLGTRLQPSDPPNGTYPVGGAYTLDLTWRLASLSDIDPLGDNGPNHGFRYLRKNLTEPPAKPLNFYWVLATQLENKSSEFYMRQCGDFDPSTSTGRFISGEALLTNTIRHEAGLVQSHHLHYVVAQDDPSNNFGVFAEKLVAGAGTTQSEFLQRLETGLSTRAEQIQTLAKKEPYPVNFDENNTYLGEPNFAPNYAPCP